MHIKTHVSLWSLLFRRCGFISLALLLLSATTVMSAAPDPKKAVVEQQPIDLNGDWDGITIKQTGQSVLAYAGSKEIFHGNLTNQKLVGEFVLPTTLEWQKCGAPLESWFEAELTISQSGNTQTITGNKFKNNYFNQTTCKDLYFKWEALSAVFTRTKAFQMVDPACSAPTKCAGDFLKDTGGKVSLDETKLLNSTVERSGVVADGVTQLLLRVKSGEAVTFTLAGNEKCDFGTLEKVGGSGVSCSSLTVEPTKTGENSYVFAVYRAPLNFPVTSVTPSKSSAVVFVEAKNSSGTIIDTKSLQLQPPPVVLVHGLWDKPGSWKTIFTPALEKAGYSVYLVNHNTGSYPSTGTFDPLFECKGSNCSVNSALPPMIEETKKAIGNLRAKGIAATQVDVVGHSMGGLIARAVVKTTKYDYQYQRLDNQQKGDFHKIITIGTPHQGTRLADVLVSNKCQKQKVCIFTPTLPPLLLYCYSQTAEEYFEILGKPIGPAVYELQTGNTAIKSIGNTSVPAHAIIGIADDNSGLEGLLNGIFKTFMVNTTVDDTLGGFGNHDDIVPAESQRGGLSGSATTLFPDVTHLGEIGSLISISDVTISFFNAVNEEVTPKIAQKVIELLGKSPNSSSFGNFSAWSGGGIPRDFITELNACKKPKPKTAENRTTREDDDYNSSGGTYDEGSYYSDAVITFEPLPETRVNPGQTIQIRLDIANGDPQEGAIISIGDALQVIEGSPPYLVNYTAPEGPVGKVDIFVQTFNGDSESEIYAIESSIIVNFPNLGMGYLAKDGTIQANPSATFLGGAALEYDTFLRENVVTTDQTFEVRGSILPPPEHATIEESVLLAVVFYLKEGFLKVDGASSENCNPALADSADKGGYYTIKYDSPEFKFDLWDGKMENLSLLYDMYFSLNFQSFLEPLENGVPLFKGQFEPGHACFYFGYGLNDGTVVFNGEQSINVRIKP